MRSYWFGIAVGALVVGCRGEEPAGEALGVERGIQGIGDAQKDQRAAAEQARQLEQQRSGEAAQREAPAQQAPAQQVTAEARTDAAIACQPGGEIEAAVSRLMGLADGNNDGQVSQAETHSLANFIVGGFFFRADQNADGTVTPEEGRQARAEFMSEHPEVSAFFKDIQKSTDASAGASLAQMFDAAYGKSLSMGEAREAARLAVNELHRRADADRNGVISAAEARTVAWEGASALGRSAFQAADADNNQRLNLQEFQAALQQPASITFNLADTNNDGLLSREEAATALQTLVKQLSVRTASAE